VLIAETEPDYIDDLRLAVETGDEFAIQESLESAAACETCISEMINILGDPSYDKIFRKQIANSLLKSGNQEGILSVIKSIVAAHNDKDLEFKDELMQTLADVNSIETADALADILTEKASFSSELQDMPEDVIYAIKKAIRLTPNENVGENLAQKYFDAPTEEEKKILYEINHPVMIARLAADAYEQKDTETSDRLMEQLAEDEDNTVIKGMMILARDNSIPLEIISNMLSFWSLSNADNDQSHFAFVEYLSNAEFSPEERAIAASALAYETDKEMAISALKKAQLFEEDPLVQESINNALNHISENSQVEMVTDPDDILENI